jgi:hypothetical protein
MRADNEALIRELMNRNEELNRRCGESNSQNDLLCKRIDNLLLATRS